jgi:hypothetical protein
VVPGFRLLNRTGIPDPNEEWILVVDKTVRADPDRADIDLGHRKMLFVAGDVVYVAKNVFTVLP